MDKTVLENLLSSYNWWMGISTIAVAIGILGEYVAHFIFEEEARRNKREMAVSILFGVLVLGGVVGEYVFGKKLTQVSEQLQQIADIEVAQSNKDAAAARKDAELARTQSAATYERAAQAEQHAAQENSRAAKALEAAEVARKNAEGFRLQIAQANERAANAEKQAADAESHLADALRQSAQASEGLQDIRASRSLTNVSKLIGQLEAFMGTEYTLCVFQDDEAVQFTKVIDDVLQRAGWIRKPVPFRLGVTSLMVFGKDRDQAIPTCVDTGLQVQVRSADSFAVLSARPLKDQSRSIKAALALLPALHSSIRPINERNVGDRPSLRDDEPGDGPMQIVIGKKP